MRLSARRRQAQGNYKKYLDDITDLALDSDKFAVEIKKVNEIY